MPLRRRSVLLGALGTAACGIKAPPAQSESTTQATEPGRRSLSLVTYNVLADPARPDERIPVLLKLLEEIDADVLALQEVAPWFLEALGSAAWSGAYQFAEFEGNRLAPGGQTVLSKFPIRQSRGRVLSGRQRRTVVVSELDVHGERIDVATTHMESFLEDGPTRAQQLDEIFAEVKGDHTAIVAGDFNFGDEEQPDTAHLDPAYFDVWQKLRPGEPGFTWNMEVSEMARRTSFEGEQSRRLDRILVRSKAWSARSIEIIGNKPVHVGRPDLFPSDHFGLVGVLERAV